MAELSERDAVILNCVFNPNLPIDDAFSEAVLKDEEEETDEAKTVRKMELEAIETAERGDLDKGLDLINRAIELAPKRPSLYNNRAHIYQYRRQFEDAFNDLSTAIELAGPNHKKTLCQAHSQRGVLHKRADRLELARSDFEIAAQLGSKFAKNQLVEMNPYAALCNTMLRQVMDTFK